MLALLALLALAVLQYYWVGQVSEAARLSIQSSASTGAAHVAEEFDRELARAYLSLQMDALILRNQSWGSYKRRYDQWRSNAPYPDMVSAIYLATVSRNGGLEFDRFDAQRGAFSSAQWPTTFLELRHEIENSYDTRRFEGDLIVISSPRTIANDIPALILPVSRSWLLSAPVDDANLLDADFVVGDNLFTRSRRFCMGCSDNSPLFAYTIIVFDGTYMTQRMLPELANRYLSIDGELPYYFTVVRANVPQEIVYSSRQQTGSQELVIDARVPLLTLRLDQFHRLVSEASNGINGSGERPLRFAIGVVQGENLAGAATDGWELHLTHRLGSLEAAVTNLRLRNLAISSGILLLLAFAMFMLMISTRRAQALAQSQVDFVTTISHELRTPLTVICSAGENLADGLISQPERTRAYGALIHREGRRLTEMVEQVLIIADTQAERSQRERCPVAVEAFIKQVLSIYEVHIQEMGFQLDTHIAMDLPYILIDVEACQRALHNLLSNAMKYSAAPHTIQLSAQLVTAMRGQEVQISVQNHGSVLAADELPQLFQPFFRGRSAREAQISGSGLGLSIVKMAMQANGGHVSVESSVSAGTRFTLHFPALSQEQLGRMLGNDQHWQQNVEY